MPKLWDSEEQREQIAAWARANNINPNFVPADRPDDVPRIDGGTIHYLSVVDENEGKGRPNDSDYVPVAKLDPHGPNTVLRVERSTPLLVEPNGVVRKFLASHRTV